VSYFTLGYVAGGSYCLITHASNIGRRVLITV